MDDDLKKENPKTLAYVTSLDMILKAQDLARAKGKKPGEDYEEELREVMRANPKKIKSIESKENLGKTLKNYKKPLDLRNKKDADPTDDN